MNMRILVGPDGSSELPDVSDDDPARRKLVDVTLIRKTCVDTGESVLKFISGHKFSENGKMLGDDVLRTKITVQELLHLYVPGKRREQIHSIFRNNH